MSYISINSEQEAYTVVQNDLRFDDFFILLKDPALWWTFKDSTQGRSYWGLVFEFISYVLIAKQALLLTDLPAQVFIFS